ncbi:hypothetical protein MCUN1_001230 [Malassezia cuniculi]|uniref:DNA-directed RNA polymerase III subunit Rpc5 n=1 Tax=Malassezia cuniculi TaxID=948313 RepID=A0AAF0EU21_9BASI|nr:hypothetical protein MCUN1_001230 [Malassezia cuniculi]
MADDAPAASLPVYLASALPPGARLELFQYPLYARGRPLPVPASAAQRGQRITSRWRPRADRVEMDMPLDMREAVYDQERGAEMGESAARMGTIGAVKQERDAPAPKLDRIRLESAAVPNATRYFVGTVSDGALHLSPLHSVLQLRPSMQHLDVMHELADAERRRDAEEEERARGVVSLNVAVRAESGGAGADVLAAQREAEAERWVDMRWTDDGSAEAQAAHQHLLATSTAPLYSSSEAHGYL